MSGQNGDIQILQQGDRSHDLVGDIKTISALVNHFGYAFKLSLRNGKLALGLFPIRPHYWAFPTKAKPASSIARRTSSSGTSFVDTMVAIP